jgi:hypothetical protein
MILVDDKWNTDVCDTLGVTPQSDGSAHVHCKCHVPGYIAVGLVKSDDEIVLMPEIPMFRREIEYT